jgi:hypothetical protein
MSTSSSTREAPWHVGLQSARLLFKPGLVLQAAALGLVLSYYYLPAARGWFVDLARWRLEGGYVFSAVASAVCGGLLPFLYLRASAVDKKAYPWPHLIFFTLFWAWKGAEVDLWYRTLSKVYGNDPTPAVIACKVLSDQFVFNVLYASPVGNLIFAWKESGFRWKPVLADVRAGQWFWRRIIPVLISVWVLWIPVVICVYSLPDALQIPLFNVVLCFWSLLFAHITTHQQKGAVAR